MCYNIRKEQSQMAEYTDAELAKWLNTQMPSLLEQMCIRTFDERSDREGKAFEALPVTCGNMV